jgi:hypothetical protein
MDGAGYLRVLFSCDRYETGSAKTPPQSHSVPLGSADCVSVVGQRN